MSLQVNQPKFQRISGFFQQAYSDKADDVFLQSAILEQVRRGVLSSGKAAELLGQSRWEFAELMTAHDVPSLDVTVEELDVDRKSLENLLDS
jgi:predicted HTH domain antitoxin